MRIMVFAERDKTYAELCSGGRQLGSQVEAIRIGTQDQVREETKSQVDKVWLIPAQSEAMLEDYTETIAKLLSKEIPNLLLVEPTKRCKLIAGRLAAMIGASVMTDVAELNKDGEASHLVYGGAAVRREKAVTTTAIATVGAGVFEAMDSTPRKGEIATLDFVEPANRIKVIGKELKPKVSVDLPLAKRVVGVGRGMAQASDLAMVRQLAEVIGGEVGCTRPIAEGEKWMPKETYIGVSGVMLAPEVYIALGISGQVQHTVGINRSKVVIAVNKEKSAPIFQQADYGIVGDLYKVVPALIKHFSKR
jgi:electron transfer flavoprotein alpha subunit